MDYYTTMLHIAGIEHQKHDGENLYPLLTGESNLPRDELFWHFPHYHGSAWKPGSALRKGNWKLVVHYEDERTELFNLANDPGEETDVFEKFPEKTEELKAVLNKKLEETGARFPQPNPIYQEGS
jgi:arylsulfatase A-like enzyme